MKAQKIQIALDIGSRSIKAAAFDEQENIIYKYYQLIKGKLRDCLKELLESLCFNLQGKNCTLTAITGSNANFYADLLGLHQVNDILSTYLGVKKLIPEAGAILEIAGEHAKFIRLSNSCGREGVLKDFFINSACSSGTGSFLEQEAHRLGLSLEAFGQAAAQSEKPPRIAGRCAVFAKTDVVHLHQNGVPLADIAHALCCSVAQNISNELVLSRNFQPPLVFVGGVAANLGIQKALKSILDIDADSLIIPSDYLLCGTIGSFLSSKQQTRRSECPLQEALAKVKKGSEKHREKIHFLKQLTPSLPKLSVLTRANEKTWGETSSNEAFLGIDIGSTTTNIVCINPAGEVQAKITLPTQGQPLNSVFHGLSYLHETLGVFHPKGIGITGSGRKLVAEIIGADAILNEITAHAMGGLYLFPEVDTIFDIGGQDSKYIQIENGSVVNFAMNKVCSAGTGSFLEEMSELLGLKIKDEFAVEAMQSTHPLDLGERCTVFMSSELVRKLQEGQKREDLAAGLCYSVVKNYISRVVGRNKIGRSISFQGGVASNPAVVSALENYLQKPIHVLEHHEIAGALGVALFASNQGKEQSRFRGFENLDIHSIETRSFECQKCANSCSVHYTRDFSGNRFYSGGLCDRYEGRNSSFHNQRTYEIDLFEERDKFLNRSIRLPDPLSDKECVGIPRALHFYDLIPFWSTFFNNLQIDYRVSEPTRNKTVHKGISNCPTNPCLPVKTAYGHCIDLKDRGIKKIFIPSIPNISFLTKEERMNHVCPAAQAWPYTSRALFADRIDFLTPIIRFGIPHYLKSDVVQFGCSLGFSTRKILNSFQTAMNAQQEFYDHCQHLGRQIMSNTQNEKMYALILSRPYLACAPPLRLHLKKIFNELNIMAVPLDMVPCEPKTSSALEGMYWYYGKRFLQAVEAITDRLEFVFIHLSNFACGADSFIIHFLRQRLKGKPYLELEIDEHNQFTGMRTRLEAFHFSQKKKPSKRVKKFYSKKDVPLLILEKTKLMIPQMSVHAFAFQASFQACGVDAEVMPLPDEESINYGKKAIGDGECLPCPLVIGDMLKHLNHKKGKVPSAFFMISGDGPCRLGQYPYLQRLVLDERGFRDIPIFDASQDQEFYDRFGILPASFKRRTWQGVVAVDLLFRKWQETRPYVPDKKFFDEVYTKEINKMCDSIKKNGNLSHQLKNSIEHLDRYANRTLKQRPIIAVLGENYIRCNSVANGRIADLLEDLGAEVWFPSLYEWVYYGNWTARLHCLYEKKYKKFFSLFLTDAIQHWDEHKISRTIRGRIRNLAEPSMGEIFRLSSKYIPNTFEGETMIEVARTIDFFKKGACGVIHVVPFGCMMGTIVETLSERISRDLSGFPTLSLQYDGQDNTSQISKLEAFMIRACMWHEKGRKNEHTSYR